jgi:integrase
MRTYQALSAARIKKAKATAKDVWLSDSGGTRGSGQLLLRITRHGVCRFYFRFTAGGRRNTIPLGRYSHVRVSGFLTLREARETARRLSASLLPATPASQSFAVGPPNSNSASKVPPQASTVATTSRRHGDPTVLELCNLYYESLVRQGKPSARQQQYLMKHISKSELAHRLARDTAPADIATMLRELVKANLGRTAGKVRAMLHAAFAMAIGSKYSATSHEDLTDHSIETNPVSQVPALTEFNKARHRVLTRAELREVWKRIQPKDNRQDTMAVRALRLNMFLGGQRCIQLLRAGTVDVDLDAGTILLQDPKGARTEPRPHLVPLIEPAKKEVAWLLQHSQDVHSKHLFVGDSLGRCLAPATVSVVVREICRDMMKSNPATPHFQFSDLRRTIETTLASLGVLLEHRAQLQSHGISGVQAKHYDMYEYMKEKRDALLVLERYLSSLLTDSA